MAKLIPHIDTYIDHKLNVLVSGLHGVGKSYSLMAEAEARGLTMKYYSCATLDPFTDLVGVPYPSEDFTNLKMVRPREIDEAQVIFFDEMNRAQDAKTLNAILEIVQFHTINGELLPNLQFVWGAVNPAGSDYQVLDMDPALVDRFDIYLDLKPRIDVTYLVGVGVDKKVADALATWYNSRLSNNQENNYISPRRMEKIGMLVTNTKKPDLVPSMLPPDGKFPTKDLVTALKRALGVSNASGAQVDPPLTAPSSGTVKPDRTWIRTEKSKLITDLDNGVMPDRDIDIILQTLSNGIGIPVLVSDFADLFEALPKAKIEAMVNGFAAGKRTAWNRDMPATLKV